MMREIATDHGGLMIQGFRPGGGVRIPYVYVEAYGLDQEEAVVLSLTVQQANELGEYLRQEAEFAGSAREEGK